MLITLGAFAKAYFLSTGTRATWGAVSATTGLHTGSAPASLTEMTSIADVTVNEPDGSVDATTRANAPSKGYAYGLDDIAPSIKLMYSNTDPGYAAILKARATRTSIAIALLDGDKSVAGTCGYWGDWIVGDITKNEDLDTPQAVTVALKPAATSTVTPVERVAVGSGS